jgi:hypothetical protein
VIFRTVTALLLWSVTYRLPAGEMARWRYSTGLRTRQPRRCHRQNRACSSSLAGVDKLGVKETDTIVVDTAHPVSETVAEACTKDPQASFVSKVRSMIKAKKISLFDHT